MGVVIRSVGVSRPGRLVGHGARRLADAAARSCLSDADVGPDDVDLLVNAGVYRERGLGEPALAALIQEDVEANVGHPDRHAHGTFSFDIDNAACGVLTAVHIARSFLLSGAIRRALVVTSDSGPGPRHARWMPYDEGGGAVLLERDDGVEGFTDLRFATFPEYAALMQGYWTWEPRSGRRPGGPPGRNRLVVEEHDGFRARAAECAIETAGKMFADAGVTADEIDLLVATPEAGFGDAVAVGLGVTETRVMHLGEQTNRLHTAQPVAAVAAAMRTGRWEEAGTVLFVSAGAGITIACALYRR
ncbi:MAG TPA: 3-oxoacyl-[acyl-carrier-protein] synthase III C-terminal domain-containing protein [Mycobacteriales bacterium]|jgi:3-oxoacyl-[acyl-carrier-protein] synthase-3|nr:3-oxoacyl-[acyl-carrier-protein] synthase III C-terminal domain-containing protein [Mycobacteriales bacterium]